MYTLGQMDACVNYWLSVFHLVCDFSLYGNKFSAYITSIGPLTAHTHTHAKAIHIDNKIDEPGGGKEMQLPQTTAQDTSSTERKSKNKKNEGIKRTEGPQECKNQQQNGTKQEKAGQKRKTNKKKKKKKN